MHSKVTEDMYVCVHMALRGVISPVNMAQLPLLMQLLQSTRQ